MFIIFSAPEVALLTTISSKYGPNVLVFEWTMQIAYDPILIAILILKEVVAIIRDENNKLLLITDQSIRNFLMLPMVSVKRGSNYADTLHKYLQTIGIITEIDSILGIERVILMSNYPDGETEDKKESKSSRELRANFNSLSCKMKSMNEENGLTKLQRTLG